MLILITGKPGSFKTAKCASLAIDYLKAGRRVFTNIDEFNYEGVLLNHLGDGKRANLCGFLLEHLLNHLGDGKPKHSDGYSGGTLLNHLGDGKQNI